jgi:uncharacterized membrane protein YgcG
MKATHSRHLVSTLVALGLLAVPLAFASAGCMASSSEPTASDSVAAENDGLDSATAISRAMQWVDAKLQYCEAAYHQVDKDDSCTSTCERQEDPRWDAYRSDCSGLVSYAWGLSAPGPTTWEFAPAAGGQGKVISFDELSPGDALNHPYEHIILFKQWVSPGVAELLEEPGCGNMGVHYAHQFTASLSQSNGYVYVEGSSRSYTPIRISGDGGGVVGCDPGGLYCGGDAVDGDKDTLYRCVSGTKGEVLKQCNHGCQVNPGEDDNCKAGNGGGGGTGGNNGGGMSSTGSGDPSTGSGNPGSSTTGSGSMSSGGGGNGCHVGGFYCGTDKVDGDRSSLYQCTGGSSGTLVEACENGCNINPGADDACKPGVDQGGGNCKAGGKYCGGDKVTGAKNILYKCDHGDEGDAIRQCPHGCNVNPGEDDSCQ